MAAPMTRDEWVKQMQKWHLDIHYYDGWETRGRPGSFSSINGVGIHHTGSDAGQGDSYDQFLFETGRPDEGIPAPLCHASCDMDGDLHLGSIHRANHFGSGSSKSLLAAINENYSGFTNELIPGVDDTDGNAHFYGLEVKYDGGQPMTAAQYNTAVRFAAAICDFYGWSALSVIAHREWTRRKGDPGHCNMAQFRKDVQALLNAGPDVKDEDMALTQDDKNFIDATMKKYAVANNEYLRQMVDDIGNYAAAAVDAAQIDDFAAVNEHLSNVQAAVNALKQA